jgi:hypothetical protein
MLIVSAAVLAALAGCAANQGHNEKEKNENENEVAITIDQLPPAVRDTMNREAGGGTLSKIEKETKEGKTSYEADTTIGGHPYEIKVAEDGTLLKKKMEDKDEEHEEHEEHEQQK